MHINLPKYYYFIDKFDEDEIKNLNKDITVIYRNYNEKIDNNVIIKIRDFLKKRKIKFLLANNIKTSIKLNLNGAYIPAFNNKIEIYQSYKKKEFLIVGSAHNLKEIRIKERQKVEAIFLSPLFNTKKSKYILGVERFNILAKYTKKKLIALGGINKLNIKKLSLLNIHGFASISFFKNTDKVLLNDLLTKNKNYLKN
jgi:thiamine-phosphate pyrophosphorylase